MKHASAAVRQRCAALVPHAAPFRFIDRILELNDQHITGACTFDAEAEFYRGHFPGAPVTPGVILTECMAQIGLVAFGIYLTDAYETPRYGGFAFVQADVRFLKPVMPGETVRVEAEKLFFRLGKLKVRAVMTDRAKEPVCRGVLAGVALKETPRV